MITEERLKLYLDDIYIYNFYLGDFELRHKYSSPIRDDPRPSFQIKTSKTGNIYWKDYGLDKQLGFDAIALVMHLFNLDREQAVKRIWRDMIISGKPLPHINLSLDIGLIPYTAYRTELRDWELSYWKEGLDVDKDLLKFFNVWGLLGLFRTDNVVWKSTKDNPAFLYLYSDPKPFKCYRPLDPYGDKFRGQDNGGIIEGYDQLPDEWDHLIITKSTKDIITLARMGIVSCSPTSENSFRTLLEFKEELDRRFKNIYIMFDNDEAGIKSSNLLSDMTSWNTITFPKKVSKDPSDAIMKVGLTYDQLIRFFNPYNLKKRII